MDVSNWVIFEDFERIREESTSSKNIYWEKDVVEEAIEFVLK